MKNICNNQVTDLYLHHQRKPKKKKKKKKNSEKAQLIITHLKTLPKILRLISFKSDNYQKNCNSLSIEEQKSLQELNYLNDHTIRVQDKH